MSIFNEKDNYFSKTFAKQFNSSDESSSEDEADIKQLHNESSETDMTSSNIEEANETNLNESLEVITDIKVTKPVNFDVIDLTQSNPDFDNSPECVIIDDDDDDDEKISSTVNLDTSSITEIPYQIKSIQNDTSLNESSNEDRDFLLKLMIAGEYRRFPTTYKSPISHALRELLDELKPKEKTILLNLKSEIISLDKSPFELNLNIGSVLDAVVIPSKSTGLARGDDPDIVQVKLQDGNRKNTKELKIIKSRPLVELKKLYAKEINIENHDVFKLIFDGDSIDDETTAEELDIEGGETFDVVFKPT